MSDTAALSVRITELEVKVAFQEHTIAQLDEELQKSVARFEDLKRRVEELVKEHQNSLPAPANEKPPHY